MARGTWLPSRVRHELRLFAVALQFFTRIPITLRHFDSHWLNQCARYFPLVGLVVGAVGATVLILTATLWPLPLAVVMSMAATVVLTGGFHEDGLADSCDGLGGSVSREHALEIMKDSRLGSYGALGLGLTLAAKAAATLALGSQGLAHAATAVVLAHALSRAMPVVLLRWQPYAGDPAHAKAKPLAQQVSTASLLVTGGWVAAIATGVSLGGLMQWPQTAAAMAACLLVTAACGRWFQRRLGGFTGDTLGALQQWSELAILLALSASPAA